MGTTGQLDSVEVEDVRKFEAEFLDHLRRSKGDLLAAIRETGKFEESTEQALQGELDAFKKNFTYHAGTGLHAGNEAEDNAAELAMESDQEQIVKQKRG